MGRRGALVVVLLLLATSILRCSSFSSDCNTVSTNVATFRCGQTSDCDIGLECCFDFNGNGTSNAAGRPGVLGCDPTRSDDCQAGHKCIKAVPQTIWTGCSL